MMSLLIFLSVLSVLVIVHEWGHFITARSLGVKVEKFSVGFGKKLFSRTHDGTEFMVCAIPLGGFVKMAGDERSQCKGNPEEYYSHPPGHRALIILMGPLVNVIFAYVCFYFILVTGYPMLAPKVGKLVAGYPAEAAGIREGDRILQIDAKTIESWDDLQEYVMSSKGNAMTFRINRDNAEITKTVSPQQKKLKNLFGQEENVRIIGVQPAEELTFLKYGPVESIGKAADQIVKITVLTYKALYHVVIGSLPAKDALSGPIRIFDIISEAAKAGFSYLIYIMAVISANLAIFNLLPIPVLDGGHLLFLALEKIRNRPLTLKVEENLTKAGLGLLLMLMGFVVYNDIDQMGWLASLQNFFLRR